MDYTLGRNLIVAANVDRNIWINSAGNRVGSTKCMSTEYIPVIPGSEMVLQYWQPENSNTGTNRAWTGNLIYYDQDKQYIGGYHSVYFADEHLIRTYTIPDNCYYVKATYEVPSQYIGTLDSWDISSELKWKLEYGSEATEWRPAPEDVVDINEGGVELMILARNSITVSKQRDIDSSWRFYRIASSTATPSAPTDTQGKAFIANHSALPSGWTLSEPSYDGTSTNSLYYCDLTAFTDGDVSWSPVSKSTSYEAAKEAYNKSLAVQSDLNASKSWYAVCETAAGTVAKIATISPVTTDFTLHEGVIVLVKFTATNSGAVGNITLNVNNTGAKNIKYIYNGSISNIPSAAYLKVNQTYQFYYDGTYWVVQMIYNTNTSYTQFGNVKAGAFGIKRYTLIMKDTDSTWVSFVNQANSTATTKTVSTVGMMLGKVLYSAGDAEYPSGAASSTIYDAYAVDLRYSTNCGSTLTTYKSVYLVGTIGSDGLFYLDPTTWWTQTIPTEEDGKTYVYLGEAYATTAIYLSIENNAYQFYEGKFRALSEIEDLENKKKAETAITQSVEYIIGTHGTTATANWTGISTTIDALKDGTKIAYKMTSAGAANVTLNLTLSNGTSTGALPVYYSNTTRLSTHYGVNAVIYLIYDQASTAWRVLNPYTNSTYNLGNNQYYNTILTKSAIAAESIIVGDANGYAQAASGVAFNLSYPILWCTTALGANKTNYANLFTSIYDRNLATCYSSFAGTARKVVYLVGTVIGNTFTIASNVLTVTEPTTDDGKVYIPIGRLGNQSNGKNYFFFECNSTAVLYAFKDGLFGPVSIREAAEAKKTATNYLSSDNTGIMVADMKNGEQTPSTATGRNVFIDDDSVDIRDGQTVLASFAVPVVIGDKTSRHIEIDEAGFETKLNGTDELIFIGVINDSENNDYAEILERTQVREISIVGEDEDEEFVGLYLNTPCVQLLDIKYGNTSILNLATMYDDRTVKFTSSGSTYLYEYVTVTYYTDSLVPCFRFGENNTCKSKYAVVFGTRNEVYASYALATGYGCKIYGQYSVAEGYESSAIGMASHAEGFQSHAVGYYAHAEGYSNDANGGASHAEGLNTTANGYCSHAEGNNTAANGQCSHAAGEGTIARGSHQMAIGKYNVEDLLDSYALIIGNGSGTSNRSNALAIKWDGTPISPAITYSPNDTFSVTQLNISGVMAVTNTTVILSLVTDKYMDLVSTVTVTSLVGALRGVKGYIDGSLYNTNWITSAYVVTATKKSRKHVEIRITKSNSAAFTNATTDTPLSLYATLTLTFST